MTRHILPPTLRIAAVLVALAPTVAAQDQCYADYKAKRGPPLELHYGVVELGGAACNRRAVAKKNVTERLAKDGWDLLKLMDVFSVGDTVTRRQFREMETDAGPYFLRY